MSTKERELLDKLVVVEDRLAWIKAERKVICDSLIELVGQCPHCMNWHYPHCGIGEGV